MGRAPIPQTTQHDESDLLQVGMHEMLAALESTFTAIQEGSMTTEDYSFTFTTVQCNEQSGICYGSSRRRPSHGKGLGSEMLDMVKSAFQDVENGSLKEGGYYFELSTEYFSFESGEYPMHEKDAGCSSSDEKQEPVPSRHDVRCPRPNPIFKHPPSRITMGFAVILTTRHHNVNKMVVHFSIQLVYVLVASTLIAPSAASPIASAEHPLTLTAGVDGTIPFNCSNDHQSDGPKYYTVTFEGKDRPFYRDGTLDPEGLMSLGQFERFRVNYVENDSEMSIEIHISSVSLEDQGTYIVMVIIPGEIPEPRLMTRVVIIYIPPGPAACFIQPSTSMKEKFEVHCHSKRGSGDATLTCFQNGVKIPYIGAGGQIVYRRAFWLLEANAPVSCCAHDIKYLNTITEASCNQWPKNQVIHNPDPTEKVPTEMALETRPLSNDKEIKSPPIQTTIHSGCAQSFYVWQKAKMLLLMAIVAHACKFVL